MQEELALLRSLWDMVGRVMSQFKDWKQMLWDAIDVDFLVEETKKLLKEIKTLHKQIRNFPVYKWEACIAFLSKQHGKVCWKLLPFVSDTLPLSEALEFG